MATSTEQLNDAIIALQGAATAYNGKKAEIDAVLATAEAGYDALAADLRGVVNGHMYFTATVDPDEAAPTKVNGGVFNTIAGAIKASPPGSYCVVYLMAGKTHVYDENTDMLGRYILVSKVGPGANPVMDVRARSDGNNNLLYHFTPNGGEITFFNVAIKIPTVRADPALPWAAPCLVHYFLGSRTAVTLYNSTFAGGIVGDSMGVVYLGGGNSVTLNLYVTTLDGPLFGVAGNGAKVITRSALTLLNGAAAFESGTVGVDVLQY